MAGPFKTGAELRDERMREMAQTQSDAYIKSGESGKAAGAMLGTLLAGKLADAFNWGEGGKAGDVAMGEDTDLGTSKGNFDYAKKMRDAGFEDEARALEDRAIKLYKYESSVNAAGAAGKLGKVSEPTDRQLEGIMSYWAAGDDEFSEMTNQILEDSKENPTAGWGLKQMNRVVAQNVNEVMRDLEERGLSVPQSHVEKMMVDTLKQSKVMRDDSFLGGFLGTEPVVDVNQIGKVVSGARTSVMDFLTGKVKPEDAPVETGPAQTSTQMPGTEEDPYTFDVQGKVPMEPDTQATPLDDVGFLDEVPKDISRTDKQRISDIDRKIKQFAKNPKAKKAVEALKKQRLNILANASRR